MRFHGAEEVVSDNGVIAREVERDGVAFFKECAGIVHDFGVVLCSYFVNVGADVVDE